MICSRHRGLSEGLERLKWRERKGNKPRRGGSVEERAAAAAAAGEKGREGEREGRHKRGEK